MLLERKPSTIIELPAIVYSKKYSVGNVQQILRSSFTTSIRSIEKVKIGPRSSEDCLLLENGERIIITNKPKFTRPPGIDGVLRPSDDGKFKWLSHITLEDVERRIVTGGLAEYSASLAIEWPKVFRYQAQGYDENGNPIPSLPGLRPPQLGALFAIGSHWSLGKQPATIVMPTGTGKTETMLCALAALPRGTLLVAVPSKALRKQIADKFSRFGLLRTLGLLPNDVPNPVVGILTNQPKTIADLKIFEDCNVVVSVIQSLTGSIAKEYAKKIAKRCGVLIVDEAHHIAAKTWLEFREAFADRYVLQFTATPFRGDGKLVDGEVIFSYPLRRAQEDGYFKRIQFVPIHEISPQAADELLAIEACKQLRVDMLRFDHLLMARCSTIKRAEELLDVYRKYGGEFTPLIIHSELPDNESRIASLLARSSRIAICVNMLGEGFDLPALKIAALHDPQKSMGPLLQFTGRFTRTSGTKLGDATVIANIADPGVSISLERLYSEDSDWNIILSEMSSQAAKEHARLIEFLSSSIALSDEDDEAPKVSQHLLKPAMSMLTYSCIEFTPKKFFEAIPKNVEIVRVWLNDKSGTLYYVTRSREKLKWSRSKDVVDTAWNLFVLHFDKTRELLYLGSSDKSSNHENLAKAVGAVTQLEGEQIFRSLGRIGRLVFNNLGVTKHGRRNLSYAMYTGADVRTALSLSEKTGSRKANLNGVGWEQGKQITIGCSYKGRVWSRETGTIPEFIDWAENVGEKLLDTTISTADIIESVLIPDEVTTLPNVEILGIDWPVEILRQAEDRVDLRLESRRNIPIYLCDIKVLTVDIINNSIEFHIVNKDEQVLGKYTFKLGGNDGYSVTRLSETPIVLEIGKEENLLEDYLNKYPPLIRYIDLAELDGNLILRPQNPADLKLPVDSTESWDWSATDITKESIWKKNVERTDSVQWIAAQKMIADGFEVVFDDDGPGEAADLICMKEEEDFIKVVFIHCKFSGGGVAGARIKDVVEVSSQAIRSARWAGKFKELCRHIINRNEGRSTPGRVFTLHGSLGDINRFAKASRLKEVRPEIVIVQPGVSVNGITNEQSMVLGAAASYIKETIGVNLLIICSE